MWTKEVPKIPGWYWFFGYIFGKSKSLPNLEMININGFGMPIAHNTFLSDEQLLGVWIKVETPEPFDIETAKWVQDNLLGEK